MAQVSYVEGTKLVGLLKEASAGQTVFVRIHSANQLAVGTDPLMPSLVIDFSKEILRPIASVDDSRGRIAQQETESPAIQNRRSRQTGKYLLEIKRKTIECVSLKHLLAEGLKALEAHRSGTLEKLSAIKPRTKRIVARDPRALFDDSKLAKQYSERLTGEWWFGTNNSAPETNSWLERATALAGLKWGSDVSTSI